MPLRLGYITLDTSFTARVGEPGDQRDAPTSANDMALSMSTAARLGMTSPSSALSCGLLQRCARGFACCPGISKSALITTSAAAAAATSRRDAEHVR